MSKKSTNSGVPETLEISTDIIHGMGVELALSRNNIGLDVSEDMSESFWEEPGFYLGLDNVTDIEENIERGFFVFHGKTTLERSYRVSVGSYWHPEEWDYEEVPIQWTIHVSLEDEPWAAVEIEEY